MRITARKLRKLNACREAVDWFYARFPDGADLATVAEAARDEYHWEWLGWFAAHATGLTFEQRVALIEKSNGPDQWAGATAAYAPGLTLPQRVELAEKSDDPAYWHSIMEQEGVSK